MQQRRGTAAQWTSANPILAAGEIGFETDTGKFKLGNGSSTWSSLNYFVDGATLVDGAPDLLNTLNELAAALGDDPSFFTTVATNLSNHEADTISVHGIADTSLLADQQYVSNSVSSAVSNGITAHSGVTTSVHGIADTSALATKQYADDAVSTHSGVTTSVHGIADTSALATTADISTAITASEGSTSSALSAHTSATTSVHGIADTSALVTTADIETYRAETTNVHGIADTSELATNADIENHNTETTNVHGIADTADLVLTNDSRLSDTRTPTDNTVSTAKIVDSAVTADKLAGDSVTEAKLADGAVTSGKIANGTIVNADISASAEIDWTKLAISSTVSSTELGYLDGVTSAIQTQLDAKYSSASASTDLALKADLASPALTGTPTAPTATLGTNTTQIATTAFVKAEVDAIIASAPGALNTLDELAAALGDDANFATTVTNSLAAKAPLASPTFTGTVTLPAAGIVFSDGTQAKEGVPSRTTINSVTDTYNLSTGGLALRDTLIECNKATGFTVTIPANSTTAYPVGTSIDILQVGAGQVTIAGAAGVTVNATPGLKLRAQWSSATLFKRATDTWVVMGDLSA